LLVLAGKLIPLEPAVLSTILAQLCLLGILYFGYAVARRFRSELFAVGFVGMNLLIHELIINGAYYNTNITAMFFLYLAVYILVRGNYSVAAALLAAVSVSLSFFFRIDIVLMLPAVALILFIKRRLKLLGLCCAVFAAIVIIVFYSLGMDLSFVQAAKINHFSSLAPYSYPFLYLFLAMPLSILFLSWLGLGYAIVRKDTYFLLLVVLAVLPIFVFYFHGSTTPKYLLYIYPVLAWLALEGLLFLRNFQHKIIGSLVLSIVMILFIWQWGLSGFRLSFYEGWPVHVQRRKIMVYNTHDGLRPVHGLALFPLSQRSYNAYFEKRINRMLSLSMRNDTVFWVPWDYLGVLNYIFSYEAKRIESDDHSPGTKKIYYLKNKTIARVIEIRFDQSNERLKKDFNSFYDEGYTNVFLSDAVAFQEIIQERFNELRHVGRFADDPAFIIVGKNEI
jgi:hypothetical protein